MIFGTPLGKLVPAVLYCTAGWASTILGLRLLAVISDDSRIRGSYLVYVAPAVLCIIGVILMFKSFHSSKDEKDLRRFLVILCILTVFPILFVNSFAVPALCDIIYHSKHPDSPGFHEIHWSVINAIRDQQDPHRMLQLIRSSADRVIENASDRALYIYDLGIFGEYKIYEVLWQQRDVSGQLLISEIIPTEELPARKSKGAIRFSLEGKGAVSYSQNGP